MSALKRLREKTGAGLGACRDALADTSGDVDRAAVLLWERGLAAIPKPPPPPREPARWTTRLREVLGPPDPPSPCGVRFADDPGMSSLLAGWVEEIGSGWFWNGFLELLSEDLERLRPCLDAWSFLVPAQHPDRVIIAANAHGCIVTVEDMASNPPGVVRVLDPLQVEYHTQYGLDLISFLGDYLPNGHLPRFVDRSVYDGWVRAGGRLDRDEILAIVRPLSLGGAMVDDNFQIENVVRYYETTAPIYAKAFAGR